MVLKNPIGPSLGFFCNFVFLPLLSCVLGLLLFPDNVEIRFGLFATGISSMGVSSSLWSVILTGNVELSIIVNVLNTILAYGTTPFWLFKLGTSIVDSENFGVPYNLITQYICFSFIPLLVGIFIQYIFPRASEISKPILLGITFPFMIFIIIVSIMRGAHVFSMPFSDSWKFVLAGLCLPSLGYLVGWFLSRAFKLQEEDSLMVALSAINIHSVIAITLFNFIAQPQRELAVLFPISAIILSPIPVLIHFVYNKLAVKKL
ncbi:sodium/bile acid cotransporter 4-like isoform X2 [Sitodiplosis mosellana]|nr:sodium/bile acid cotransporter 4-like isoform X2 [Sitodiplosis mosellana]